MASIPEVLMLETIDRLRTDPAVVLPVERIRRNHRTIVRREDAPAVHLVPGTCESREPAKGCRQWHLPFTVRVLVRDDAGYEAADPVMLAVMARLNPTGDPFPHNARLLLSRVSWDQEIAEGDALGLEIDYEFTFQGMDDRTLDANPPA